MTPLIYLYTNIFFGHGSKYQHNLIPLVEAKLHKIIFYPSTWSFFLFPTADYLFEVCDDQKGNLCACNNSQNL